MKLILSSDMPADCSRNDDFRQIGTATKEPQGDGNPLYPHITQMDDAATSLNSHMYAGQTSERMEAFYATAGSFG